MALVEDQQQRPGRLELLDERAAVLVQPVEQAAAARPAAGRGRRSVEPVEPRRSVGGGLDRLDRPGPSRHAGPRGLRPVVVDLVVGVEDGQRLVGQRGELVVQRPVGADVEAERGGLGGPLALDGGVGAEDDGLADRAGGDPVLDGHQPDQGLAGAGRERHPGAGAAGGPGAGQRGERLLLVDAERDGPAGGAGAIGHPQNTRSTTACETRIVRRWSLTISSVAPAG